MTMLLNATNELDIFYIYDSIVVCIETALKELALM